jgi:hypothetical protein
MNENKAIASEYAEDFSSLDELEAKLSNDLEGQLSGLEFLEKEREKIGNPEGLGATIESAIWEQFRLQIGSVAGEDFILENRGNTLNLRDKAHIQTTENFKEGKIATHNEFIDYQQRYDNWQSNLEKDINGNIKTHSTRSGEIEANLVRGARDDFDKGRPKGNFEKGIDIDHTVSAGEIIRDAHANAHLSKEEQIAFANGEKNLNEMRAELNRSKKDTPMTEWLDNPNSKGQKPAERFNISKEEEKELREKDREAREEYSSVKKKGEERSLETGNKSQLNEAKRIGGKALRAVLLGLLSDFLRVVIKKLVSWFKNAERKWSTFVDQFKEAWKEFWANLKTHLVNAGKVLLTTIMTAVFGPIVSIFTKLWTVLKTGVKSLWNAISYIRNPENRTKPFSILMLEAGKIVVAGLSGIGAIVLGEVIEKGLLSVGLTIQIPLLGSLASIIGMFLGAVVSGVIGALVLRWIDKIVANRLKSDNGKQQIEKQNEILATQEKLMTVVETKVENIKETVAQSIIERHDTAAKIVQEKINDIRNRGNSINAKETTNVIRSKNDDDLDKLFGDLNKL